MSRKLVFITGGARSGKSTFALKEASRISGNKAFIATAVGAYGDTPLQDEEMKERIERHRKERGKDWDTYEEPIRISEVVKKIGKDYRVIVIDCLTLWLSNLMHSGLNIEIEIEHLISSLVTIHSLTNQPYFSNTMKIIPPNPPLVKGGKGDYQVIFIVSNEVGMGIVPDNELARRFRDMAGILNQKVAEISDEVYVVVAGIPLKIKEKYDTGDN